MLACGQVKAPGAGDMGDRGMDQANLLDLQQMPDLSLEAGQSCLVNAVLGNQEFILESQRQFCQVDISIQAEIQGLQDLLAVLNAFFLPGVQDPLHRCMAHPVIQAGEDPEADGTCHGCRGRGPPSTLIKRLEEERVLSKPR